MFRGGSGLRAGDDWSDSLCKRPTVRPDHVVEDSRCPLGTTCVWAGRVVVRATVSGGNWSKPVDLILGVPVQVADGMLTLTAVTPGRRPGQSARITPSRFAFSFQGSL
ncbi:MULTISPECIES: hypothetical protein [unclassified Sphingomonas]|uniref:hypothetical protein n=1 Tax=unclassified Sphingomonas TaxID=196159 RepID=UPI00226AB4E5|nr:MULTISPECIES: hypothetical protein [unclassified Sphingomonas]